MNEQYHIEAVPLKDCEKLRHQNKQAFINTVRNSRKIRIIIAQKQSYFITLEITKSIAFEIAESNLFMACWETRGWIHNTLTIKIEGSTQDENLHIA